MIRRVGLIGGECTGKSVLAAALAESLPACVASEQVRAFVQAEGRPPRQDEQAGILRAQAEQERSAQQSCALPWLVGDPAPFMTAVYSLVYFDDPSLLDDAVAHLAGYDLVLWCAADIPWIADAGMRDGPEFRAREQAVIEALIRDRLGPAGIEVVVVTGTIDERVALARAACAALTA